MTGDTFTHLYVSAICILKDREPGAFVIRDSNSFRGAYGLAMKVASPPPMVQQNKKGKISLRASSQSSLNRPSSSFIFCSYFEVGDITNELVRHFLIETSAKGVRLKGCPNEPYFGNDGFLSAVYCTNLNWYPMNSMYIVLFVYCNLCLFAGCLSALVYQHAITPLALPCKLMIPTRGENAIVTPFLVFLFVSLNTDCPDLVLICVSSNQSLVFESSCLVFFFVNRSK